jgi:hypothetical protein
VILLGKPGTTDEKPVMLDGVFWAIATDGAGDDGAFLAIFWATFLAAVFLALDSLGLAIVQKSPCIQ